MAARAKEQRNKVGCQTTSSQEDKKTGGAFRRSQEQTTSIQISRAPRKLAGLPQTSASTFPQPRDSKGMLRVLSSNLPREMALPAGSSLLTGQSHDMMQLGPRKLLCQHHKPDKEKEKALGWHATVVMKLAQHHSLLQPRVEEADDGKDPGGGAKAAVRKCQQVAQDANRLQQDGAGF
ncbi:Hypothetical predicted protein [Podarcis lilfordi]|uniref:Uncharacterized protein n=1 Tax=Podarcis lilfordi TaxID=74358 RepID=A0AA35KBJ3_9SAUR|nr:Hypothetical predicted protein [Podarcis lilfordi]